jgi:hypothetical protein
MERSSLGQACPSMQNLIKRKMRREFPKPALVRNVRTVMLISLPKVRTLQTFISSLKLDFINSGVFCHS